MTASKTLSVIAIAVLWAWAPADAASRPPSDLPPLPTSNLDLPSYDLLLRKMVKECRPSGCKPWAKYVRGLLWAKKSPATSCEAFTELSDDTDFPLFPVVLARQAELCDPPETETRKLLERIKKYIEDEKPRRWLESTMVAASVNLAEKQGGEVFVTTALEASRISRAKKNKVLFLQRLLEKPALWDKARLKEIQSELWRISPKFNPVPDDWIAVGLDALSSQDPELAVQAFQRSLRHRGLAAPARRQALESLRVAYKMLQKKPEALAAARRLWEFDLAQLRSARKKRNADDYRNVYSSGLQLARAHWTENDNKAARLILNHLERLVKGKQPLGDLIFVRARMFEEEGRTAKAVRAFDEAARNTPDALQSGLFKWHMAWLLFKEKKFEGAAEIMRALKEVETEPGRKAQQMFWLGRAYKALGQDDVAKAEWEKLIAEDPFGYYPLLAYRELKRHIPREPEGLPADAVKPSRRSPNFRKVSWDIFEWLVAVGELPLARQLLNEEAPLPDPQVEDWSEPLERYAQAQAYAGIFSRMSRLLPWEKHKIFRETPSILFPTPFRDLVEEASRAMGLWPEYVFSIMRQESSFDSQSVSPAHAFGLLQLLPSVAKKIAPRFGSKLKDPDDLLDPAFNIRLGTAHLRDYWDMFEGQFLLTTAGYNASPDTVKSWVKSRYRGDPLIFIEDIPYEETRSYVKLVLRNFINYQRLNSATPLSFPEWCLEGIQAFKK